MFEATSAILVLCVLTLIFCTAETSDACKKDCSNSFRYIIQSHRGAGNLASENTLESFELAWQIGAVPEADVRATSDGVIVAFHDENLERLAPSADESIRSKSINDIEWAVASKLDVGEYKGEKYKGQHIPKISDALDHMKGHKDRKLYLDVKKVPLDKLAELARERGVDEQVILASSKYDELRTWKSLLPKSHTLLWNGGSEEILRERMAIFRANGFKDITQLQIHVNVIDLTKPEPFSPSIEFLQEIKQEVEEKGILFQVLVIGSDDPQAYHKLMGLGIKSFATDDPLVTLAVIRKHQGKDL